MIISKLTRGVTPFREVHGSAIHGISISVTISASYDPKKEIIRVEPSFMLQRAGKLNRAQGQSRLTGNQVSGTFWKLAFTVCPILYYLEK